VSDAPVQVPTTTTTRAIDAAVVVELMENARDELLLDLGVGAAFVGGVVAAVSLLARDAELLLGAAVVATLPALHLARWSAVARRRRRCRQLGVDPKRADALFRRVDLFTEVAAWRSLSDATRATIVDDVLAGRRAPAASRKP
jgi:hypothetical protein